MSDKSIRDNATHIYCNANTRESIRELKRAGETYDAVLRQMIEQYDPDTTLEQEDSDD